MPQSRNRPKHHQHVHHHVGPSHTTHRKVKRSAAFVISILTAVLGLAVAYFTRGLDVLWLLIGAGIGAVAGYLVGRGLDKSIEKK
ncbi:MAG: hypothetical protein JWR18_1350 [Segetibacter sp.]|nr:hypothetical protein [Segetibacter sp.]